MSCPPGLPDKQVSSFQTSAPSSDGPIDASGRRGTMLQVLPSHEETLGGKRGEKSVIAKKVSGEVASALNVPTCLPKFYFSLNQNFTAPHQKLNIGQVRRFYPFCNLVRAPAGEYPMRDRVGRHISTNSE